MHRNTWQASRAAACADEQGKFWEFHDALYSTQDQWNGEATGNPDKFMKQLGGKLGLDAIEVQLVRRRQEDAGEDSGALPVGDAASRRSDADVRHRRSSRLPARHDRTTNSRRCSTSRSPRPSKAPAVARWRHGEEGVTLPASEERAVNTRKWMALISLLGLFLGAYLTLYKFGVIGTLACNVGSCETVQTSRWSTFLGLPVATWGVGFLCADARALDRRTAGAIRGRRARCR